MNEKKLCESCRIIFTPNENDIGRPECTSCSNKNYSNDLLSGNRVELKINLRMVKQSTFYMIKAMIEKDIEEYKSNSK